MQRTSILLAGGGGTRLLPYTTILPKPLLPILGKQIVAYIMEDLCASRIDDFIIAVADRDVELFENYLGISDDITYSASPDDFNTAGRLERAIDDFELNDNFLLHYGDIITDVDYDLLWEYHVENDAMCSLVVKRGWQIPKGLVRSGKDSVVTEFIERYPLNEDIWIGVAMCKTEIQKYIDDPHEDLGKEVFPRLVEEEELVLVFPFEGFFLDVGTQRDYQQAEDYLKTHNYHF